MAAKLLWREVFQLSETLVAELVVWNVPEAVRGSAHMFKYRLALICDDVCVLRYDNEAGKGDHKHLGSKEYSYRFKDIETLLVDFWTDVDLWMTSRRNP